ncbi:hypothetical protein GR925_25820 [Streptomyces sp. HUCO-GS316]|uniref:RNA methyltransferase n=1 Tax=Streptomyces sp. HUCO-GS316 TaxID=2692198 RepID=UPI00136DCA35|nr:RNA methyltransferase [Streptomyces sp. HUCO-GS316]MXM66755.1 hypothetical protein [Streptomyces sp. HUCO-GS316]
MTHRHRDLEDALRALGEHGDRIAAFDPGPEDLDEIGAGLTRAHKALTAARGLVGRTGCPVHPSAPVDPAAGGGCLLCETARRRGQLPQQEPATAAATVAEICEQVAAHGQEEAVRRYGPRAVTRALLHCQPDPDQTKESA